MPIVPKAQSGKSNRATFLCRLNYIEIKGNLGRGERISEEFFITNDRERITGLLDPRFIGTMGSLEYNFIRTAPVVAYSRIDLPAHSTEHKKLVEHLLILDAFEDVFWLHTDNCVGHELAFLCTKQGIFSNIYQGIRSRSDGTQHTVTLSADQIREIVRLFRETLLPDVSVQVRVHTKANSSRFTRALSLIGRAQKTTLLAEKITFYCSALEALLSTSQAELSHQIAERVALISTHGDRLRIIGSSKSATVLGQNTYMVPH